MKTFNPGDRLKTREDFEQVPVGAVICYTDKWGWKNFYQKLEDYWTPDYFYDQKKELTLDELLEFGGTFAYWFDHPDVSKIGQRVYNHAGLDTLPDYAVISVTAFDEYPTIWQKLNGQWCAPGQAGGRERIPWVFYDAHVVELVFLHTPDPGICSFD